MLKILTISFLCVLTSITYAEAELDSELMQAMAANPNIENGKKVFQLCLGCHGLKAWGTDDGIYPQIAGQHRSVIIKQLADIRAGNRDNPTMIPIAKESVMGGPQAIADVSAYLQTLKMTPNPEFGKGNNLSRGEKLYYRKCAQCHGVDGSGDAKKFYPRISGQHYNYLLRQLQWIKNGKRRNANKTMQSKIKRLKGSDFEALADYISRIKP